MGCKEDNEWCDFTLSRPCDLQAPRVPALCTYAAAVIYCSPISHYDGRPLYCTWSKWWISPRPSASLTVYLCLSSVNIANSQEWTLSRAIPELRLVRLALNVTIQLIRNRRFLGFSSFRLVRIRLPQITCWHEKCHKGLAPLILIHLNINVE